MIKMQKKIVQIVITLILFLIAMLVPFKQEWVPKALYVVSYMTIGMEIIKEALENIVHGKWFDETFLMTIATIGALAIGEFPEAVAVMLFYQVGEMFQDYAVDQSKKSITSLMNIRPDYANVKRGEDVIKVNPKEVNLGDIILIKPGEKVPLDGTIIEGKSLLDTANITGEALPREVNAGDEVISGCINQTGSLTVKVNKEFGESTVSKILDLVENASEKKSKSENFITKFAKYYTPIVVGIAVLLAIVPPMIWKSTNPIDWIYRALTFLVVSCPCAIVLSIPLGFFSGIGNASKHGILMKGSNYLETLSYVKTMVFDKTGTLTKGVFEVQTIKSVGMSQQELLELSSYAENESNHPISISLKKAYGKPIEKNRISSTQELSGLGIMSVIDGKQVIVGNEKLMQKEQISYTKSQEVGTTLYVAVDKRFAGYIVIADTIKEDAQKTIKTLKTKYQAQTIMLTGDRKQVGEAVAKELGMETVYAELLPNEKAEKVEEIMKASKGAVAFVGDGTNDAPVLAVSDIGIAMGALGSDAAIEAADIVIMTDEPSKLCQAIQISQKTLHVVKENIIFAIAVKIAVLGLSAFGISTMWEAVFADVGVTVIAVLNALRILIL